MLLLHHLPEIFAMLFLIGASGFFSCSEAAFFSLSRSERTAMKIGTAPERAVVTMLQRPERLLTAILFWNLTINMAYFALASIVSLRLGREEAAAGEATWLPQAFALEALLAIILLSELAPKNVAVLKPRRLSCLLALPLRAATRALDPVLPWFQAVSRVSARLLLPQLEPEPYLEIDDLERAIEIGATGTLDDEKLLHQERLVLQRIIDLSNARVEELMQPRRRCTVLPPPLAIVDLPKSVAGDYVLITENESDQILSALPTELLALAPENHLERRAEPVAYVPWCATAASALDLLRTERRHVAAVINEIGETIGIVTLERLLDAVLRDATRVDPADAHAPVLRPRGAGTWEASAATPLRRLVKRLRRQACEAGGEALARIPVATLEELNSARSVTLGGLLQELLKRPLIKGDRVFHAGLFWTVMTGPATEEEAAQSDEPILVCITVSEENSPHEAPPSNPPGEAP